MYKSKNYFKSDEELKNTLYRRSIYAIKDIKKGESFSKYNVKCLRPRLGLEPKYFSSLLSKRSKRNISYGTPIKKIDLWIKNRINERIIVFTISKNMFF